MSDVIGSLHRSVQAAYYLLVSGAGTRLVSALFAKPGASETIIGAEIPYSRAAMDALLGGEADQQYVSLETAQLLAKKAHAKAAGLVGAGAAGANSDAVGTNAGDAGDATASPDAVGGNQRRTIGVGCTGKIESPARRSADRVFTAFYDGERGICFALPLSEIATDRDTHEQAASALLLNTMTRAAGLADAVKLPLEYDRLVSETTFGAPRASG